MASSYPITVADFNRPIRQLGLRLAEQTIRLEAAAGRGQDPETLAAMAAAHAYGRGAIDAEAMEAARWTQLTVVPARIAAEQAILGWRGQRGYVTVRVALAPDSDFGTFDGAFGTAWHTVKLAGMMVRSKQGLAAGLDAETAAWAEMRPWLAAAEAEYISRYPQYKPTYARSIV